MLDFGSSMDLLASRDFWAGRYVVVSTAGCAEDYASSCKEQLPAVCCSSYHADGTFFSVTTSDGGRENCINGALEAAKESLEACLYRGQPKDRPRTKQRSVLWQLGGTILDVSSSMIMSY